MTTTFMKAVLVVTVALMTCSIQMAWSQTEFRTAVTELTKKIHDDPDIKKIKGQRLVIAEFENINGKGDAVPRILQEMLTTDFVQQKHFKVVERAQLNKALSELKLGLSDLYDSDKVKRLGKLVGASYLLIGSISDLGGKISIAGRVVSLEQGENLCAADVTIGSPTSDTALSSLPKAGIDIPTPELTPQKNDPVTESINKIPLSLDDKKLSKATGTWIVRPRDFGLLGGSEFLAQWSELLPEGQYHRFSAGDLYGDKRNVLALFARSTTDSNEAIARILQWQSKEFREIWQSPKISYNRAGEEYCFNIVNTPTISGLLVSNNTRWQGSKSVLFRWTKNTFVETPLPVWFGTIVSSSPLKVLGRGKITTLKNSSDGAMEVDSEREIKRDMDSIGGIFIDMDGDNVMDFATVYEGRLRIFDLSGEQKAVQEDFHTLAMKDENFYIRAWYPGNAKLPYIVVVENKINEDKKPDGGYFHFIQFNGRNYERVWSSLRFGDEIVDIQVGDPKNDGKSGLLILSKSKGRYELTKIIAQ